MISILIAEKKKELMAQAEKAMAELGYRTERASEPGEAGHIVDTVHIDLILADVNAGALELCSSLREQGNDIPFITLIENPAPKDKRIIFRSRADGYLETPFDPEELGMRVRNLLWRCRVEDRAVVSYGECRLVTDTFSVECAGRSIGLRRMEFLLLEKLLSYPGRIFTRAQLMDELWGYDCESGPRTVDVHIRQLRKKLRGVGGIHIQTIRGLGYRAAVPKAAAALD